MPSRREVYALDDEELVATMAKVAREPTELTHLEPWALDFAASLLETYRERGVISWKQRRCARRLLLEVGDWLERSARMTTRLGRAS